MPRIGCPPPFAGEAEWLARIARSEDVHASVKAACWEGSQVRPDRRCIQEIRFHLLNQVRAGEGFDLHIYDRANASKNPGHGEVKTCVAGGEAGSGKF
jgi:hypothetical protein